MSEHKQHENLLRGCGFVPVGTGGNCTAWELECFRVDGSAAGFIRVTGEDGIAAPDEDDVTIEVGIFNDDGDQLCGFTVLNRETLLDRLLTFLLGGLTNIEGQPCEVATPD